MVNVVYQRVNEVLSNKQVSVNALSKLAGMAQTTLNTQLRGERALSVLVVVKILEIFPDISAEWLLRGEGEMCKSNSGSAQVEATAKPSQDESIWKAKYEAIKECYDILASTIGGNSKRNLNVG